MVADILEFRAYDSTGTTFVLLPDFSEASFQDTYCDVGFGSVSYPVIGQNYSSITDFTEIGCVLNGAEVLRYFVEDIQGDDTSDGTEVKEITGRSTLAYLEHAIVYPSSWPAHVPANHQFITQTPGTIWRTLIQRAQSRSCLTQIDVSTFSGTTDSNGAAWPNTMSVTYNAGTNYLTIMQQMVNQGILEVKMIGRSLRIYKPGSLGLTLADTVVVRSGQNVVEASSHRSGIKLGNAQLVEGDNNNFVEVTASGSITSYGRIEKFTSHGGVADTGTLTVLANADIAQTNHIPVELTSGMDLTSGIKPYSSFGLGDFIWYEVTGTQATQRVRQISMAVDANRKITCGLTLSDLLYERDVELARQVALITGNATTSSTPTTSAAQDTIPPAAPSGADFSSAAYNDPVTGKTDSAISLSWVPPTLNSDGTALDDLRGYIAEWHYVANTATTSNVLSSNDQGFESAIGSWTSAQATLSRSSTVHLAGGWSLVANSTSGGDVTLTTGLYTLNQNINKLVQAFANVRVPATYNAQVNIVWCDTSGNVLSTSGGGLTPTVANNFTQLSINALPNPATVKMKLQVVVKGTAINDQIYLDVCGLYPDDWTAIGFTANNFVTFSPVQTGKLVECHVAAVDSSGNVSPWATTPQHTTSQDATPPGNPSAPVVAPIIAGLKVTWDGKDVNGNIQPIDFDRLEIYYNTSASTTGATKWDVIKSPLGGTTTIVNLTYNTSYYVYFVSYDKSGNPSGNSAFTGPNSILHVNGQPGGDVTSLAADIITAGVLNATFVQLAGRLTTATGGVTSGSRVEFDGGGLRAYNVSGIQTFGVDTSGNVSVYGGTISTSGPSSTSQRVVLDSSNTISFYDSVNTLSGQIYGGSSFLGNGLLINGFGGSGVFLLNNFVWILGGGVGAASGAFYVGQSGNQMAFTTTGITTSSGSLSLQNVSASSITTSGLTMNGTINANGQQLVNVSFMSAYSMNGTLNMNGNQLNAVAQLNNGGSTTSCNLSLLVSGTITNQSGDITAASTVTCNSPPTTTSSANVFMGTGGRLNKFTSSLRYKQDVQTLPLDEALRFLDLRSVTYRGKNEVSEMGDAAPVRWGFIAEEADELGLKGIVVYDGEGKPDGFDYAVTTSALRTIVAELWKRANQ